MINLRTVSILLVLLLSACAKTPDEDLIRQNLDQVVAAVKARQPKAVVQHLTKDFLAQERMGAEEIRRFMIAQFFRNRQINIVITGLKVTVDNPQHGSARFRAVVTGGAQWLPERLDYYQVETDWQKRDGDWLIHSAKWQPVLASG